MVTLLEGVRVLDLTGESGAMAGRVLGDLGAEVVLVEPVGGSSQRAQPNRFDSWAAGKASAEVTGADDPVLAELLAAAHVVIDTPGAPDSLTIDPGRAPHAVWVSMTPFGLTGPRAGWRASDLGILAASGNMYVTGHPERAPVRCTEPSGYAHSGGEAAFAVLTALWTRAPQRVDLSMQEAVDIANMAQPARYERSRHRGSRGGANIGRTREIWPAKDGWVSFGLRGGKARIASLEIITKAVRDDGLDASALEAQDWSTWSNEEAPAETLRAVELAVGAYFERHTMQELYDLACETNLMLAPANSPREILGSKQLDARNFFAPLGDVKQFPVSFVQVRSKENTYNQIAPRAPAPELSTGRAPAGPGCMFESAADAPPSGPGTRAWKPGMPAWAGVNIIEFGSGAAGPIATRYFVEHGATVLRVESRARPDFLRMMAIGPKNPLGVEGSEMYDGLNVGKRNVTLNLKHPESVALVKRLIVEWADAIAENYAPRAMRNFGLDYDSLVEIKPDVVMISACLNGQTGPHKDYPGFGGQGAALAGYNWLTGWPDLEPVGPYGTITDSLAPRYVATALAAGLHAHRRTGKGCYLDLSQVESGTWTLTPWLLDYQLDGILGTRDGNRSSRAVPHGAFPCADEGEQRDRWVAIACWTDDEWARLAEIISIDDPTLTTFVARQARIDDVEAAVSAWTSSRTRADIARELQAVGIEAVPVQDFGDMHDDEQLAARDHFIPLEHPLMGPGLYERNGFRLSDAASGYRRAGPTLGQDNDWVLGELLGLSANEQERLRADGALD